MQEIEETQVESLGWGDPLEKGMATPPVFLPEESHGHSEEPYGLQSMESTRVGHNVSNLARTHARGP